MRGAVGVEPLLGVHLVRAQDGPHLVVEDFRSRAGKRAQTGVLQACQVEVERFLVAPRPFGHLERGEGVHMHVGYRRLHGADYLEVIVAVEVRVDTTLQTDLGCTELCSFNRAALHLVEPEQIRVATQVERQRTLRESAELALERADVGVVDIAVRNPCDVVPVDAAPQIIGHLRDQPNLVAPCAEQRGDVVLIHDMAATDGAHDGRSAAGARLRGRRRRDQQGGC